MIASALVYLGALLTLAGLVVVVLPRRFRGARGRRAGSLATVAGIAIGTLGFALPARDVVVERPRSRLDAAMPRYLFHERHAVAIAAPPLDVDRAIRAVTADEIRFYRALTSIRRLGRRGPDGLVNAPRGAPMLALATRTGFLVLADAPGRELVLGVAGPASRSARERDASRDASRSAREFAASADGYASIALNFRIARDDRGGSVLSTETRVFAPDDWTRRRLAAYWRVILPGSALIRRGWLDAIRRRAEGQR